MVIEVTHTTTYTYSQPVFLEPHILRLRPRCDGTQQLLRFELRVEPQPAGLSESCDSESNAATNIWFVETTQLFTVTSSFTLRTLRSNPFDFIMTDPAAEHVPLTYVSEVAPSVAPYCVRSEVDTSVAQFARTIADEAAGKTLSFLTILSRRIPELCEHTVREEGDPRPAQVTLAQRKGSCRDLAVLFIEACRALGIAARFVSGYREGAEVQKTHLHAWAEVYLPGGGWRGYDPTSGLAVADRHVAVAAGRTPLLAAPVTGSFRGTGASLDMQVDIQICVRASQKQA
jgi:transglutaminase-like putative cysteine protease